jgi:hypothetical protein
MEAIEPSGDRHQRRPPSLKNLPDRLVAVSSGCCAPWCVRCRADDRHRIPGRRSRFARPRLRLSGAPELGRRRPAAPWPPDLRASDAPSLSSKSVPRSGVPRSPTFPQGAKQPFRISWNAPLLHWLLSSGPIAASSQAIKSSWSHSRPGMDPKLRLEEKKHNDHLG